MLERVVSEFSGDWFVDLHGDNDVLVATELQLFPRRDNGHEDCSHDKALVIKAALDTWDRLGRPSPNQFEAALARLAC